MRTDRRFLAVLACFLLSGFAALLFQTVWTREFAFVFGTSDLAVATVLAAYMGGLAVGSAVAARLAPRVRRPVLVYGLLELAVGASALAVPLAIQASRAVSVALFGGRDTLPGEGDAGIALFYLGCSFAILLVPTAFMGATLPLLTREVVRRGSEIGARVGALYATNTLGAVLGTVCAAFVLMPSLGLRETVWVGAGLNAVVFGLAAWVSRSGPAAAGNVPPDGGGAGECAADPLDDLPSARAALVLPLALASGVASFTYEVLWTRLLGHVMGGSVYAFATMLASFLVGIALGSAVASRFARRAPESARGFAFAQLGIAATAVGAYFALDALPDALVRLGGRGMTTPLLNAAAAAAVLVPSTLFIGATFPLAVRVLARGAEGGAAASAASARVYAWNTVGAIVGALGAGFFVVPALGYAGALVAAVSLNLLLAALATGLAWRTPRMPSVAAASLAGLAGLALVPVPEPWGILSVSPFGGRQGGTVTYFGVGRSATVLLSEESGTFTLRTNGLPEAGVHPLGQRSLQNSEEVLSALPLLLRPDARSLLVVGFGGGSAVETIPSFVERVDVIELEPEVLAANRTLSGRRARDPLADPRVAVHIGDARGALVLTSQRWDVVVSQPSHPWTAGASHLYTREFFSLVRERMSPGGAFLQWIGSQFVDELLLRSLVASLLDVFPHVAVFNPPPGGQFLFVASDAPLDPLQGPARAIAADPATFAAKGYRAIEDVALAMWLDEDGARRFAQGAPLSTDDHNLLHTRSPRVLRIARGPGPLDPLVASLDDLSERARSLDVLYLVRRLLELQDPTRALRVVDRIADPDVEIVARALVTLSTWTPPVREAPTDPAEPGDDPDPAGPAQIDTRVHTRADARVDTERRRAARERVSEVLARRPELVEARWALLREQHAQGPEGAPAPAGLAQGLPSPAAAVLEGWLLEAAGDEAGVRVLEERLAAAGPTDPWWSAALRLRALWRVAAADPGQARAAIALLDQGMHPSVSPELLLVRARAARAAGYPWAALDAIAKLSSRLGGAPNAPDLSRRAAGVLDGLGDGVDPVRLRNVEQRLARHHRGR